MCCGIGDVLFSRYWRLIDIWSCYDIYYHYSIIDVTNAVTLYSSAWAVYYWWLFILTVGIGILPDSNWQYCGSDQVFNYWYSTVIPCILDRVCDWWPLLIVQYWWYWFVAITCRYWCGDGWLFWYLSDEHCLNYDTTVYSVERLGPFDCLFIVLTLPFCCCALFWYSLFIGWYSLITVLTWWYWYSYIDRLLRVAAFSHYYLINLWLIVIPAWHLFIDLLLFIYSIRFISDHLLPPSTCYWPSVHGRHWK